MKNKYLFGKEDKSEVYPIIRTVLKVVFSILFIKSIRVILMESNDINTFINELFSIASPEQIFKFFSINLMVIGISGLLIAYLIQGKSVIKNKVFNFLFFFCLIDAIFIYTFPEIPSSVAKAIFLN